MKHVYFRSFDPKKNIISKINKIRKKNYYYHCGKGCAVIIQTNVYSSITRSRLLWNL